MIFEFVERLHLTLVKIFGRLAKGNGARGELAKSLIEFSRLQKLNALNYGKISDRFARIFKRSSV